MSTLLLVFCFVLPNGVCDSCSVTFDCGRAAVQHIEKVPEEVAYVTYRKIPEVHLFLCAPFLKNCSF